MNTHVHGMNGQGLIFIFQMGQPDHRVGIIDDTFNQFADDFLGDINVDASTFINLGECVLYIGTCPITQVIGFLGIVLEIINPQVMVGENNSVDKFFLLFF